MSKSNSRQIHDWLDLAAEQGWRLRQTKHGMQLYPPGSASIITIHDVYRCDHVGLESLRSQLKRAGLKFNDTQEKSVQKQLSQPPAQAAPPASAEEPDTFALIIEKIYEVVGVMSDLEQLVQKIQADQAKLLQSRALLKGL